MKPNPSNKRVVKAWAIVHTIGSVEFATDLGKDVVRERWQHIKELGLNMRLRKIVPCTISYSLPLKKKPNRTRR